MFLIILSLFWHKSYFEEILEAKNQRKKFKALVKQNN